MPITCVRSLALALAALPLCAACGGGGGNPAVITPIAPGPTGPTDPISFDVREWTVGTGPVRVATGDVNGDGKLDLAVLRTGSSSVGLYLGSGLRAQAPVGSHHALVWDTSTDLALADLDGDGVLDLVVAGGSARKVAVFRGDPVHRGQIFADTAWEILAFASRVAVGDVNGDGRADIVCLDETTGQVSVLRQDPAQSMTFLVGNDPPAVGACTGLILVDLDRDGALDVVTSNGGGNYFVCYTVNAGVQWAPQQVGMPTGRGIAVGDLNGDGWPDVLVTRVGSTGVGDGVVAMLQVPAVQRTFTPVPSASGIAIEEEGIQIADLDRDGFPDLCINPLDPNMGRGAVMFGSRVTRGAFATTTITVTNEGRDRLRIVPTAQTTGRGVPTSRLDLDDDGHEDVVLQDETGDSLVIGFVVDRDPPAPFRLRDGFHLPGTGAFLRGIAAADLDRDGAVDLAEGGDGEVRLRWGDPANPGTFLSPTSLPLGPLVGFCRDVLVGDWNGDGRPDIAIGDSLFNTIHVLLQDSSTPRSFAPSAAIVIVEGFSSVAAGDVNGDGHLDLTAPSGFGAGFQFFKFGDGTGAFPSSDTLTTGVALPRGMDLADLDGDGDLDVAVASDPGLPVTILFLGLGSPPPASIPMLGGVRVAAGDVNGDGRLDLVTSGPAGVAVALQSAVQRGRFLAAFALSTEPATGLALGDLDRDGRLDVAWNEPLAGRVRVAAGDVNGDGVEVTSRLNGLPPGVPIETFVLEPDLDGDGWAEIVLAHPPGIGWPGSLDVFTSR